jgi:hypothetical protein
LRNCLFSIFVSLFFVACGNSGTPEPAGPYASLVPVLSGVLLLEVTLPPEELQNDSVASRPFFDTFSWQSFIALSWPADPANRGVPLKPESVRKFRQTNKSGGRSSPIVWETYRAGFELFPNDGSIPPEWSSTEPIVTPAGLIPGGRVLAMVTKGGFPGEVNEAFSGPLIDQNRNYARYEVRINQIQYNQVRRNGWYDKATVEAAIEQTVSEQIAAGISPPQGIQFDANALEIKAAWRQMTNGDDLSRYYTVEAFISGPEGRYFPARMGLVGIHIMQKTEIFPQWIWSTFEHVDNVSGAHPSFTNGTDNPPSLMDGDQPLGFDFQPLPLEVPYPAIADRQPVQVTRALPIPSTPVVDGGYSTQDLNLKYRALLAGTVWENYELVVTQWPLDPSLRTPYDPDFIPPSFQPSFAGDPFPEVAANTTMETYFQTNDSCLECHYHAAAFGVDYSWILYDRVMKAH